MAPESLGETLNGGVGDTVLPADLAVAGAVHLGAKDGGQQVGPTQPVRGRERL